MSLYRVRGSSTRTRVLLFIIYMATLLLLKRVANPFGTDQTVVPWDPGAGLNFALLFGLGPGLVPAVLAGTLAAFLLNLSDTPHLPAWATAALILTTGYGLAAVFLRTVTNSTLLKTARDVLAFVGVALIAPAIIGLLVILDLALFGVIPIERLATRWNEFWIGNVVGIAVLSPFLLLHLVPRVDELLKGRTLSQVITVPLRDWSRKTLSARELQHALVEAASIAVVLWLAFWTPLGQQFGVLFLFFLPLLWIALRRDLPGATISILILTFGGLLAAQVTGFAQTSPSSLLVLILVLSVSGLCLGAVVRVQRETEEGLRKSEGLYRALARSLPNGAVILFDRDLRYTLADGAGLAAVGLSKSLLEGKTIHEIFSPELCTTLEPHYRAALAGRDSTFEVQYDTHTYQVFTSPIRDDRGIVMLGMALTQDITERVQSRQLLEERVAQRTSEIERLLSIERHRSEQLHVIHDLGQRITSIHSVDEILGMAAHKIRETFDYYHVHIGLIEGDAITFKPTAGVWREDPCCEWCAPLRLRVGVDGVCGHVAGIGEPALVPDVSKDPRYVSVEGIRTGAALILPLKVQGKVIGTLDMETERPGGFDDSDVPVLQALVNQVAVAIENARLYEQAEQRMRELQALYDADEALYGSLSLDRVLNTLVDKAIELLGADKSTVMVWDKDRKRMTVGAARGFSAEILPQMVHTGGEGITSLVATTGKPVAVEDAASDPRVARRITSAEGIVSLMHVPIRIGGEIFGVFGVNYCQRHTFSEDEQRILSALAQRAAIAIQNARLFDQAQQAVVLEERQRLARELHDSVSQALYGIALGAQTAREQLARNPAKAVEPLDYVLSLADAGLAEMRALIFELRPESLETEGLVAALTKQAAAVRARHALKIQVEFCDEPRVPIQVKHALYRIAQEALQNTIKHARAKCIEIQLASSAEGISLHVRDDGIGFDPIQSFPGHIGLRSMQERAERLGGKITVTSEHHKGTCISVHIPVAGPG